MLRSALVVATLLAGLGAPPLVLPAVAQSARPESLPPPVFPAAGRAADRDQEIAELRFRLYEKIDYRLELARLDSRIRVAQAEVNMLKRRLAGYRAFDFNAFELDIEYAQIALLESELKLKNLQLEKHLWQSYRGDILRLQKLAGK